jgi:hypothetical protein
MLHSQKIKQLKEEIAKMNKGSWDLIKEIKGEKASKEESKRINQQTE